MRNGIIAVAVVILALGVVVIANAAKPKAVQLTPVTLSVDGLHCSTCVDELLTDLGKEPGVFNVKVTQKPGRVTAALDESKITASQFVNLIAAHPQAMDAKKNYGARLLAYIDTEMCARQQKMCEACFTEIPKVLKSVKGVDAVTLDESGKIASISFVKDATVSTSALAKALAQSEFKFTVNFFSSALNTVPDQQTDNDADGCGMGAGGGCGM